MAEKLQAVQVLYCPNCSLPAEYYEFGPDFEKCKPWLIQNAPDLYPNLLKESNKSEAGKVSDKLQSVRISSGGGSGAPATAGGTSSSQQEEVKRLPGGKIKKKEKPEVIIEKVVRNKRKCITIAKGLDKFVMLQRNLGKSLPLERQSLRARQRNIYLMDQELQKHGSPDIVMALVGNKADLHEKREVPTQNGIDYAEKNGMLFIETT